MNTYKVLYYNIIISNADKDIMMVVAGMMTPVSKWFHTLVG